MNGKPAKGSQVVWGLAALLVVLLLAGCTAVPTPQPAAQLASFAASSATPTISPSPTVVPPSQTARPQTSPPSSVSPAPPEATPTPSAIASASQADEPPTAAVTRTPPSPDAWMSYAAVPTVSEYARLVFRFGQRLGRNPHAFSKVGDCQNITTYFLANFDQGAYNLGPYASLQETIDWFAGSFARESLAVRGGLNVAAVLSPLRAPESCQKDESPIACEYRVHNPSIAIISMEEAWTGDAEKYGKYMRQVIEYTLSQGIVPIVATKADNLEGDHQINTIIAHLAWEYDIPLWNFWGAVQPLASHGLTEDGFHLTHGNNYAFDKDLSQWTGWTMRNLTALQALDAVWRALSEQP